MKKRPRFPQGYKKNKNLIPEPLEEIQSEESNHNELQST